jgi:SAM-dependent methyltransferase
MSDETKKATKRRKNTWLYNKVFTGSGIDAGCGTDLLNKEDFPNIATIRGFDLPDGNLEKLDEYFSENTFDFLHASQSLEHMANPPDALRRWIKVVKEGGYLIVSIPDTDLYEKNLFPSRFNPDHRALFSINRRNEPHLINVIDMLLSISNVDIIKIELVDTDFDYTNTPWYVDQTRNEKTEAFIEFILKKK